LIVAIPFTSDLVEGFAGVFLSPDYDSAKPTPEFHREGWTLYCSQKPQCISYLPRNQSMRDLNSHKNRVSIS
jgi:hypothetical protein